MVYSYLWGALVLGEHISAMGVAGSLLVAVGVVAVSHPGRQGSPGLQEHAHMPLARQEGEVQQLGDPGRGAQAQQQQQLGPEDSRQEVGLEAAESSEEVEEDLVVSPDDDGRELGWKPGARACSAAAAGKAGAGARQGAGGAGEVQAMVVRADGGSSAGSSTIELQVLPPISPDWGR